MRTQFESLQVEALWRLLVSLRHSCYICQMRIRAIRTALDSDDDDRSKGRHIYHNSIKLLTLIHYLGLLFCTANLFGQEITLEMIYQLPANIRSNLILIITNTQPCPKEYTNVLSNRHLFTH